MTIAVERLGLTAFEPTWRAMQRFVEERGPDTADELWFLEHPPVFTLGMNSRPEHLLAPGDIPVVQIDRGGQVTYHGPGQLVVYPLLDLGRAGLGVRSLVEGIERAIVATVAQWGIEAVGPCGYAGLEMTQVSDLGGPADLSVVADALALRLLESLGHGATAQSATSTWRQDVSSR